MALLDRARLAGRYARWTPGLLAAIAGRHTVVDLVEYQARRRPNRIFVWYEGREQTYAEFNAAANRVAHWARGEGLGPGDVVALVMENRPEYLQVWAGMAKVGVTSALINSQLEGPSLAHGIGAADADLVVVGEECWEAWAALADETPDVDAVVVSDPYQPSPRVGPSGRRLDDVLAEASATNPPASVRAGVKASDPLFYISTSGTTGLPKAARFSHVRFMGAGMLGHLSGFTAADTIYCALPLYHTAGGVLSVNTAMRAGGTLALARRFSASRFWDDVVAAGATSFQYIGELCRYLLAQPETPAETRHNVRFAVGNGLRPDIWQAFQERFGIERIAEFYGATEGNVVLYNLDNEVGSIGRPAPGSTPALVRYDVDAEEHPRDESGHCIRCEPGEPGEALGRIGGPGPGGTFEGYTSEEASGEKVLHDVFEDGDAWFRSGDLLTVDDRGYYYFVDRIGDTFRWKGENVSTQEVAEALTTFPDIEVATVFGVQVPGADGRAGMAAVVLRDGVHELDGEDLDRHLSRALPAYALPVFLRVQDAADLTGTFKLRKVDLQRQGFDPDGVEDPLYLHDGAVGDYVPLTAERLVAIRAGDERL